jgi:transcriptional regulator with XRE-family HTH domain
MIGLRYWRRAAGLSQAELAELSGVTRRTLIRLEAGKTTQPHISTVLKLARVLNLAPLYLTLGESALEVLGPPEGYEHVQRGVRKWGESTAIFASAQSVTETSWPELDDLIEWANQFDADTTLDVDDLSDNSGEEG